MSCHAVPITNTKHSHIFTCPVYAILFWIGEIGAYQLTNSIAHIHSFTGSLTGLLTGLLTGSLTGSRTHSLTHSLPHWLRFMNFHSRNLSRSEYILSWAGFVDRFLSIRKVTLKNVFWSKLHSLFPGIQFPLWLRQWFGTHDDVIKWKHFPRYWPFVRGIHRSPHKGQWRGALMSTLICARINGWVNNREAGDWDAISPIMTSS